MATDSVTPLASNPAFVAGTVLAGALVAFVLDRALTRTSRRIRHARAHNSAGAGQSIVVATALSLSRPVLFGLRIAVWTALLWLAGEISPSLRFAQTLIYVVGRTAITAPLFMLNQRGYSILDAVELPVAIFT